MVIPALRDSWPCQTYPSSPPADSVNVRDAVVWEVVIEDDVRA